MIDEIDILHESHCGYFTLDPDSTPDNLIFNRTIALKDTWEKVKGK